ncbi:Rossmann-like and DUF2520 domain-containing protein [Granulicoccus sp. GXG6511]|uniref:Rossmann-like and DUF2520 domain-containing protein n=1 Tax=Granulicoccus sp. GXG6511 TaxID=3381351 RepID=UPI003D7DCF6C
MSQKSTPPPRTVGILGAGRVGAVLGAALRAAGLEVVGVTARSAASRERTAALLPGVPVMDVEELVARSEFVVLCVPDDALADLVSGIRSWRSGQWVAHVSGRFGVDVLDPAARRGAVPLALHPAMTFTGTDADLARLSDCCFGVTASDAVLPAARAFVRRLGARPVVIAETDRALYHAALAHGANHLVTLVAQARQLLTSMGVEEPGEVLGPLLRAALDNALVRGDDALTGPIARGDAGTIAAHVVAVGSRADTADVLPTYAAAARASAERAASSGRLGAERAALLLAVLAADHA